MSGIAAYALARLRRRRGRVLVTAGGVVALGAMVGAAATVSYALATGFDRAANRADVPDVVARFDTVPLADVRARIDTLANLRARAYRLELTGLVVEERGHSTAHGKLEAIQGPHGYVVVSGRDVRSDTEAVVERGLAREWGIRPGDSVTVVNAGRLADFRVVGIAVSPEIVAFPLTNGPRIFVRYAAAGRVTGLAGTPVNGVAVWVVDRERTDVLLEQARAVSFGLSGLEFVTRDGMKALIGQAAGIVIALLVAFSFVALASAAVMLAASSAADIQRRLREIGVLRALGVSPATVAGGFAVEAAAVALAAGALGLALGSLAVHGPVSALLASLNELMPGASLVALLAACLAGIAAVAGLAAGIPAWRAATRSPVETLRGADVAPPARSLPLPGGAGGLGMRLAAARPRRTATVAVVVGTSASVVLLLLALATFLAELERRPQAIGKQYQLEVSAPAADVARVRRLPGVESATTRYETSVADSFDLGESFDLVAYPGDHAAYEAPSLAAGRRIRGPGETEVGLALAQDLDLHLGGTLAVQALTGTEVRFRVVGLVESFENEGRVAYVQPRRILAADPTLPPTIAVRLEPGASAGAVRREFIRRQLPEPREPAGFIGRRVSGRSGFLATIVAVLRTVAAVDLAVCLYAFAQMLALTAQERRRTVALVRAVGGSAGQVLGLFAGAALVVGLLAAPLAIALERWTLGPAVGHLAVSYVTLPLAAGGDVISVVLIALALGTTAASAWVARSALREPVAAGLADE